MPDKPVEEDFASLNVSPIVRSALADPEGARQALLRYGELTGYPAGGLAPLPVGKGQLAWLNALLKAPPMWLGLAWEKIESREARIARQADGHRANAYEGERPDMAIIQWNESSGSMVEPGMYKAVIDNIEDTEGQYGPQLQFQFVILDSEGERTDDEIRGWCSAKWGPKTKLYSWARIILGKKCPQPPSAIDTDKLIGRRCDIEVVAYKKSDGQDGVKIGELYPYGSMTNDDEAEQAS